MRLGGVSMVTWCVVRRMRQIQHRLSTLQVLSPVSHPTSVSVPVACRDHHSSTCQSPTGPGNDPKSADIRKMFLDYFREQDHLYVHSSSVIPQKGAGTYFVNAGMNQFKPIFLGTVDPDTEMATYRRVTNSQKCIRVGGKHNDLDDVGKDTYHHTFFEMLGSWSFGDYFKREACGMAWELFTQVFHLPPERLYVSYFGGNAALGLDPDLECRDIWLQFGIPKERVLPFGMDDNFWDMGDSGPCGPCTEIHYDHVGGRDASSLVNIGTPEVVELWNLVFMQYDRQRDGSLLTLPARHVDTGLGLERLTAVLQGQRSNYDTDLFLPLFAAIQQECKCPVYRGRLGDADSDGVDTAYRIVADHARMFTVAIGDGLLPGTSDLNSKLRHIIHRCIKQASQVLRGPPGFTASLVPVVVDSLGDAFPELQNKPEQIADVVMETELRYTEMIENGRKDLNRALHKYRAVTSLSGEQLFEIQDGRFGRAMPTDVLLELVEELGLSADVYGLETLLHKRKEQKAASVLLRDAGRQALKLDQHDIEHLQTAGIGATEDSHKYSYDFKPMTVNVVALRHAGRFVDSVGEGEECGIVLDRTCFYSEGGGQAADVGKLQSDQATSAVISDVQSTQNYVLHRATVESGCLRVGDSVRLALDQGKRACCMKNHTATHILSYALNQELGDVRQLGSTITSNKLTFDFSYSKKTPVTASEICAVTTVVSDVISRGLPVHTQVVPLEAARGIAGLRVLQDEVYPSHVRVVSVGEEVDDLLTRPSDELGVSTSVELCGGTHVHNTGDIGSLVITNLQAVAQGTKRVTAVTGHTAKQCLEEGLNLRSLLAELKDWIATDQHRQKWLSRSEYLEKRLYDGTLVAKIDRDFVQGELDKMGQSVLKRVKGMSRKQELMEDIKKLLEANADSNEVAVGLVPFTQARDVVATIVKMSPDRPTLIVSGLMPSRDNTVQAVCYVPKSDASSGLCEDWTSAILNSASSGMWRHPGGKLEKHKHVRILSFHVDDSNGVDAVMKAAKTFVPFNRT